MRITKFDLMSLYEKNPSTRKIVEFLGTSLVSKYESQ